MNRRRTHPLARVVIGAIVGVMAITIAGCSPAAEGTDLGTAGSDREPRAAASVDDIALTADVYRTRSDPSQNGIQLAVRNAGDAPLIVVRAVLESPALAEPIVRDRTTEIGPGLTRDLAATLTSAECPAVTLDPPEAVLTLELADGSTTEVRVPTTDRLGQWGEWLAEQCFAAAVAERATISVQHDEAADAADLIGLRLVAESGTGVEGGAGVEGSTGVELVSVSDTVLFGLVRASDGERVSSLPLPGTIGETGAVSIPLLLTPARCDPHALADDKQGTLFRVEVLLDGERGVVTIAADATTRGALYDAFTRACGL